MSLPPPEPDLVRAAMHDAAALDRLLEQWLPHVLGWCARLGGPGVDPEDLAHDVCVKVIDQIVQLRDPVAFPAWIYRITRTTLRKQRERRDRRSALRWRVPQRGPVPPPDGDHALGALVLGLLGELPDEQREVVVLCYVEERTRSEASALLGVPLGTVKSRLRLGTARFRELATERGLLPELEQVARWR